MDLTTAACAEAVRMVGDKEHKFKLLKLNDLSDLLSRWRARDRKQLMDTLEDAGADNEAKLTNLRAFDDRVSGLGDTLRMLPSPDVAREIICLSMQKTKPEATLEDVDALNLTPLDDYIGLACELCGYQIGTSDSSGEDGEATKGTNPKA